MAEPDRRSEPPRPKTQAELEAEIAAARDRLATTLEELRVQTAPASLARRGVGGIKGFFTDDYGGIRPERVVAVGVAVAGLLLLRRVRRRRACRCD